MKRFIFILAFIFLSSHDAYADVVKVDFDELIDIGLKRMVLKQV